MIPVMSNDLGKAAIWEVISVAALTLGSKALSFKEGLKGCCFTGFCNHGPGMGQ